MNGLRDPEAIVAAWLDDGPTELPDETRRSIAIAARTTPQARGRSNWLARRIDMTRFQSLGAVAAVAIVAVLGLVAVATLRDTSDVGGPAASPAPSLSPGQSPAPLPAMTETFISEKYGYSIRYPAGRTALPATTFWSLQSPRTNEMMLLGDVIKLVHGRLWTASVPIPEGMTGDEWLAAYLATYTDKTSTPDTWEQITIGGSPAGVRVGNDGYGYIEAVEVVDGRAYVFTLWNDRAEPPDRAMFDAFVATVELHPEDALKAPAP